MKGCEYKYGCGHPWKICKLVYSMGWLEVAMRGVVMRRQLDLAIGAFPRGLTLFELMLWTLWLRPSYSWKTKTRHYQHHGIYHWSPHIKSGPTKSTTFSSICFGLTFLSCSFDGVLDTEIPTRNSSFPINTLPMTKTGGILEIPWRVFLLILASGREPCGALNWFGWLTEVGGNWRTVSSTSRYMQTSLGVLDSAV